MVRNEYSKYRRNNTCVAHFSILSLLGGNSLFINTIICMLNFLSLTYTYA